MWIEHPVFGIKRGSRCPNKIDAAEFPHFFGPGALSWNDETHLVPLAVGGFKERLIKGSDTAG
jgi:hypothetical protein